MVRYLYTGNYRCTDDPHEPGTAIDDSASFVLQPSSNISKTPHSAAIAPVVTYGGFNAYATPAPNQPAVDAVREAPKLIFHAKVYITAEKYDIPDLKAIAKAKFQVLVPYCWNSDEFCEATQLLWLNTMETDRALRDVIVLTAKANANKLLDRVAFMEFMSENADFCVDMIKAMCGRLISKEIGINSMGKKTKKVILDDWSE